MTKNHPFRLIIHVGAGKTGTSSIQSFLAENEITLRRKGIQIFGGALENAPIKKYSWQKKGAAEQLLPNSSKIKALRSNEVLQVLMESIPLLTKQGIHTAIWSYEAFLKRGQAFLETFAELAKNQVNIEIIAYIRRHDAWAKSAYIQWGIKHKTYTGPLKNFDQWVADGQRLEFGNALEAWNKDFLKLIVRNFDATEDVVQDFVDTLDLGIQVEKNSDIRKNTSPSNTALMLWALYNSQQQRAVQENEFSPFLRKADILYREPNVATLNQLLPGSEALEKIVAQCAGDRETINNILAAQGQPLLEISPLKVKNVDVSNEQLFAAMLSMIMMLNNRLDTVEKMLKKKH